MPLSEQDREMIEAFRAYIEDSVASDDRYGGSSRHDHNDDSILATRFEVGPSWWFEVALRPLIPQVRVAFLTDDRRKGEEVEQTIRSSGDTIEECVAIGLTEAGLDWKNPVVERDCDEGGCFYFATPLGLDELADLEEDAIRNKTLRMLEAYLVAFGPAIVFEEDM